jgi:hypothetical protein
MMKALCMILTVMIQTICVAQNGIDLSPFPFDKNPVAPIVTSDLLKKIDWKSIEKYCKKNDGHYSYVKPDSLRTDYEYVEQGRVISFEIVSFKDTVLEYYFDNSKVQPPQRVTYFDKKLWLSYVDYRLPDIPPDFKIDKNESDELIRAYYRFLEVDTRDEYGWICEYSTLGMVTARRQASFKLINDQRVDLLRKLLDYPNLQVKLYAIDALIYLDYDASKQIKKLSKKDNAESNKKIKELEGLRMRDSDWNKIYKLRDSAQIVLTCGNAGSYKIYRTDISELLSDKSIKEIPDKYESLRKHGYF